jgi:hypothetical protein
LLPKQQVLGKQHGVRRQHRNQESGQFGDDAEHEPTIAKFSSEQQGADYGPAEDALRVVDELLLPAGRSNCRRSAPAASALSLVRDDREGAAPSVLDSAAGAS